MDTYFDYDSVNGLSNALGGRVDLLEKMLGLKVRQNLRYSDIQKIVKSGFAEEFFDIGDEIMTTYTATDGTEYDFPWLVVDFRDIYWENDPNPHPGMVLQSKYATLEKVTIGLLARQEVDVSETVAQADWYYIGNGPLNWQFRLLKLNPGDPIPHTDYIKIYKSSLASSGDSIMDYVYTPVRQWLNSDKEVGEWWTQNFESENAPSELNTYNGFIRGFEKDFINVITPVRLLTFHMFDSNGIGLNDSVIYSYDHFYMPSGIEMYGYSEKYTFAGFAMNPGEDKAFKYYIEEAKKEGYDDPYNGSLTARIFYAVDNKETPVTSKTRTMVPAMNSNALDVFPNGTLKTFNPCGSAYSIIPCCVIS